VIGNVERVLSLLGNCGVKGTFFVQGMVAERFPQLLGTILAEGHEIQSHGYSHRPLTRMTPQEVREELRRGKATVEDAAGRPVSTFRAQDFSIVQENLWVLELVVAEGFTVDSSLFPLRTRRYGIAGLELGPHYRTLDGDTTLLEAPVAALDLGRLRIPVGGGGYFRLLPAEVLRRALGTILRRGRPAVLYCHPYEFNDTELADYRGVVPASYRLQQQLGRGAFPGRLRRLMTTLPFGRLDEVLAANGFAAPAERGDA
jgi:polysaccharide deacetylase family protein (PEP-CTERM system associated)